MTQDTGLGETANLQRRTGGALLRKYILLAISFHLTFSIGYPGTNDISGSCSDKVKHLNAGDVWRWNVDEKGHRGRYTAHEKLGVKRVSMTGGVKRMPEGVMFYGKSDVRSDSGRKTKVMMTDRNPGQMNV